MWWLLHYKGIIFTTKPIWSQFPFGYKFLTLLSPPAPLHSLWSQILCHFLAFIFISFYLLWHLNNNFYFPHDEPMSLMKVETLAVFLMSVSLVFTAVLGISGFRKYAKNTEWMNERIDTSYWTWKFLRAVDHQHIKINCFIRNMCLI